MYIYLHCVKWYSDCSSGKIDPPQKQFFFAPSISRIEPEGEGAYIDLAGSNEAFSVVESPTEVCALIEKAMSPVNGIQQLEKRLSRVEGILARNAGTLGG